MTNTFNDKDAILVGVIIAPHGVAGAVSAESLSDNPRRFIAGAQFFDEAGHSYTLEKSSPHKGRLLLLFQGIHSRDEAEALRGIKLYISASDSALPIDVPCTEAIEGEIRLAKALAMR